MNPNNTDDATNNPQTDETTPSPVPAQDNGVGETSPAATPSPIPAEEPVVATSEVPSFEASAAPVAVESPEAVQSFDAPEPTPPVASTTPEITPAAVPAPTPVGAPVATEPLTSTAPQQPKKSNKKLIILIASIVGALLVIGAIAAVLYFMLMSVSKEDYSKAQTQLESVSTASSEVLSDVTTLSRTLGATSTDATFDGNVKDARDSLAKMRSENEELGKLKAVRVGEGGELYKTFDSKINAYLDNADGLVTSVDKLRPALVSCSKISSSIAGAARSTALKSCSTELNKIDSLPNPQFNTYVTSLKSAYSAYAKDYATTIALTDPYGAQYSQFTTLRDKVLADQEKITDATKTFTEDLQTRDEELSLKDPAEALHDYLVKQQ